MRRSLLLASGATIAISSIISTSLAQQASGPKIRYEMDAATYSGFAAMGSGLKGGLGMMLGGGDRTMKMLELRLGGNEPPNPLPPPKGDQSFPAGAGMGKSVPLLPGERAQTGPSGFERPRGKISLFWGCGARAPKGQPVVIDFAKIAAGQMPPNFWSARIPSVREVSQANSRTYTHWPNEKSSKMPKSNSSLLGEHRITSNYGPAITFNLAQDYMPGLNASAAMLGDGSVGLSWNSLAPATGYVAWAFGGMASGGQDMVMWTSSSAREFGGGLWEWLPPETVRNLVSQKIVMPPSQTSCVIPAEVKTSSKGLMMASLNAFGPQAHFSYPPKPTSPRTPWVIDWTAKVRFRSMTMLMVGEGMPGAMGSAVGQPAPAPKPKPCKGPMGIPIPGTKC